MPEIDEDVMKNLIYCEDTHSFVYRLYDRWKKGMPSDYREAQEDGWAVIKEMNDALKQKKKADR